MNKGEQQDSWNEWDRQQDERATYVGPTRRESSLVAMVATKLMPMPPHEYKEAPNV